MKTKILIKIKNFIKGPRVAVPILIYLILLVPTLYLYSGSPPETEVQVYKGGWAAISLPYFQPLAFETDRMKNDGMNTVFLAYAYFFFEQDKPTLEIPLQKELLIAHIQAAHRAGLKVALTSFIPPPYPKATDLDLEYLNSKVVKVAKLAEKYGVEFFAPWNEPDCIFQEDSTKWMQDILPGIKEVYHGEIIWKGALSWEIADGRIPSEDWPTNFSGYDYIGFSITPRGDMTLEDYSQFVDRVLNITLSWAERDNCKGVMVTEFGTWEWDPGHSEEEIAKAHEIVLERGKDKVVGFFAVDHPVGIGTTISGKIEEVIKKWYKEIL